jgi:hypothetical protein
MPNPMTICLDLPIGIIPIFHFESQFVQEFTKRLAFKKYLGITKLFIKVILLIYRFDSSHPFEDKIPGALYVDSRLGGNGKECRPCRPTLVLI